MRSRREKPWQKNASNLLVVNSILAAISALIVQTLVTDGRKHCIVWLIFAVVALFFFIISAEKTAESFTDNNVDKYIRYCVFYNIGVLLLLMDLVGIVRHYADLSAAWTVLAIVMALLGWIWGWGCDTLFLLMRDENFQRWKDQLEGINPEEPVQDHCDRLLLWTKPQINRISARMRAYLK